MTDAGEILKSIGQASYTWDIEPDLIQWSDNFFELAGLKPGVDINSARNFEKLLTIESPLTRFAAIHGTTPEVIDPAGHAYHCTYAINGDVLSHGQTLWLEDIGRWYPGQNNKPARAQGIVRIINERRKREETLRRKSEIDELTGLANRRMLEEAIPEIANTALIKNQSCALILVSLGEFEKINEIYGFLAGDEILHRVSQIIRSELRMGDFAARFSGAKFGLIIRECTAAELESATRRFLDALNDKILKTTAGPVALKVSIGGCLLPTHADTTEGAIAAATSALDQARSAFGTNFKLFEKDPQREATRKHKAQLLEQFVECMENDKIRLAFQPIVDAQTGSAVYYEALLRMQGLEDGIFDNAGFLEPAEGLGLMRILDQRALELAIQAISEYQKARISVNVSHDSLENSDWLATLSDRLGGNKELASRLVIEITESHLPADLSGTRSALRHIRQLGCKTAIDDFGSGYTAFTLLSDFDFDLIKVDGQFTREFRQDKSSAVFLKTVREMASAFNMKTVIEWVEDIDTALELRAMGHDHFQGSLYGMPLTAVPWEKTATSEPLQQAGS